MKIWLKTHKNLIPIVQEGQYFLSGSYRKEELMTLISKGPQKNYERITLLEGRSLYDSDQFLTSKEYITKGTFIAKAQDQNFINRLREEFQFLTFFPALKSLEGFLYPDTYFLDPQQEINEQLIKAQLKNFEQKIWTPYKDLIQNFDHHLTNYEILTLASIIENEEKNTDNKPIIAGIFLNRLKKDMRLDADITLCYGLKIPYNQCRQNILSNLNDTTNPYNTRQLKGLPPTPISSPSKETVSAVLQYKKTSALYYLHDAQGKIHYGKTLEEHNANKKKYL